MSYLPRAIAALMLTASLAACSQDQDQSAPQQADPAANSTTMGESPAVDDETALNIEECIERFSQGSEVWGDSPVLATFAYDLAGMEEADVEALMGSLRERDGGFSGVFHTGTNAMTAVEEFLASEQDAYAEYFQSGEIQILRLRGAEAMPFAEALRSGCEGAPEGATIRQVTFSQGND